MSLQSKSPATQYSEQPLGNSLLTQSQVQEILSSLNDQPLNGPLAELHRWSQRVGYFNHLNQPNEYFEFPDHEYKVPLKLQLNYSRLGYQKPNHPSLPKCPLCYENIGAPGKELLRVFEFTLLGVPYFAHLTPFPLHPGHFVVNKRTHSPMQVNGESLACAAEFISKTNGYLLASNSDIEWAGASVLAHQHFQVFSALQLPIQKAKALTRGSTNGVLWEVLRWPSLAVRLQGSKQQLTEFSAAFLERWKSLAPSFSTANYLLNRVANEFTLILTLRHSAYRTQAPTTQLKAEGVGVIEMCGEAILPPKPSLTREENNHYFNTIGLQLIRSIISQNSPTPKALTVDWLTELITKSSTQDLFNPFC
ncbi:MAG: DUF4922 domain-containing protein [Sumerlaeia bacterium]